MGDFQQDALALFRLQSTGNLLYKDYLSALSIAPSSVSTLADIPFLPVRFFKTHTIRTGEFEPEVCFESSGTTLAQTSRHGIRSLSDYLLNAESGFRENYGDPASWCILALLPSYLERGNSSLVAMADHLIKKSGHPMSGFFLHDHEKLHAALIQLEAARQKTLLLGVTFALVDFAERFPMQLKHTTVMETGGMIGCRPCGVWYDRIAITGLFQGSGLVQVYFNNESVAPLARRSLRDLGRGRGEKDRRDQRH